MRVLWANSANSWPACVGSTRQVVRTNSGVPSSSSNVRMVMLRSPATIMKLAQEQGALCEIERLTFFKSLETFDHPRSMQIIAEGVETAAELRKVIELGVDALQGYFLAKPAAVPAKMAPVARKVIAEYSSASDSG